MLFCINRYGTLLVETLDVVFLLYTWQTQTEESANLICSRASRLSECLGTIIGISVALLIALRTYAIWQKNRWVFGVVLILGLSIPALNIYYYTIFKIVAAPIPLTGCSAFVDDHRFFSIQISTSVINIVYDALVLVLTWVKTVGIRKSLARIGVKTSVPILLLRDGTIYFLLLLALNVSNFVISDLLSNNVFTEMRRVITSILISRFMINLRGIYTRSGSTASSLHLSESSDIRFANSVFGNLATPLGLIEEAQRRVPSSPESEDIQIVNVSGSPLTPHGIASPNDIPGIALEEVNT